MTDTENSFGYLVRRESNMMNNQEQLLDKNLYKIIDKCFINNKRPDLSEIFVIYTDDSRERIWSFNPMRYTYDHREIIGKVKIEAVFYCDRKERS